MVRWVRLPQQRSISTLSVTGVLAEVSPLDISQNIKISAEFILKKTNFHAYCKPLIQSGLRFT